MKPLAAFNSSLNFLLDILHMKNKSDPAVYDLRGKIQSAIRVNTRAIIEKVGPHLLAYREQIHKGDVDFFLNLKIESGDADVTRLANTIKTTYKALPEGEAGEIVSTIQRMLTSYIDFVLTEQGRAAPAPPASKS